MSRYKELFKEMLGKNREMFIRFKLTHDAYSSEPKKYQDQFNQEGKAVMEILHDYENILCGKSENSGYAQYSSKLAEKWWEEVKLNYPKIDFVGIEIK